MSRVAVFAPLARWMPKVAAAVALYRPVFGSRRPLTASTQPSGTSCFTEYESCLFLLGWVRIVTGTFSPIEIAMTMIVGLASLLGIVKALGMRRGVRTWPATAAVFLVAAQQLIALRLSLLPAIAHR